MSPFAVGGQEGLEVRFGTREKVQASIHSGAGYLLPDGALTISFTLSAMASAQMS